MCGAFGVGVVVTGGQCGGVRGVASTAVLCLCCLLPSKHLISELSLVTDPVNECDNNNPNNNKHNNTAPRLRLSLA